MSLIPVAQAASGMITRSAARNLIPVLSDIASGVGSAVGAYKGIRQFARRGRQRTGGNRGRSSPNPFSSYGGGGGAAPPTPPNNNDFMDADPGPSHSSNNNNNPGSRMVRRINSRRSSRRRLGGRRRQLARGVLRRRPNMSRINRVFRKAGRRNSRKYKRSMKPIDHAAKGITQVTQSSAVVGGQASDNSRCVYIGHGTCPAQLMIFTSFLALVKKILVKAGFDVRGVEDSLPRFKTVHLMMLVILVLT